MSEVKQFIDDSSDDASHGPQKRGSKWFDSLSPEGKIMAIAESQRLAQIIDKYSNIVGTRNDIIATIVFSKSMIAVIQDCANMCRSVSVEREFWQAIQEISTIMAESPKHIK